MPRNLETDLETLRKVLSLAQNRDFVRAAALADQTLADGFEHPMLLNIVATRLEQEGKYEQSLPLLERAVVIAPNDVGARNALGLCLQRLDRHAEALMHFEQILSQGQNLAFPHTNKGNALIALGALGSANESHLRAFELEPSNFTSAAALASIAALRGQYREARLWAERALKIAPGFPDAVLSLAMAELAAGELTSAETRLRQLIMDSRAGPSDRARATGLLADVLDAGGRYDEAFEAYVACNQTLRQIHRHFAGANLLGYTRALAAAVEKIDPGQWHQPTEAVAPEAAGHVFLLGFPRSGTTLLETVLDGNPRVVSLEEHELLADSVLAFLREPINLSPLVHAGEPRLAALRQAYWHRARAAGADTAGRIFIDKHPLNTMKLPLIAKLFPQAKILFAVRDPRDVVLSCFRRRFKMNPSMYELLTVPGAAAFYAAVMTFAETVKRSFDLDWREVRYERLVAAFEQEMRGICEFIGLEWLPGMREFADRVQAREHATPSTAQLSRGLITSAMGQWRNYEPQLRTAVPVLEPWINRFGYV